MEGIPLEISAMILLVNIKYIHLSNTKLLKKIMKNKNQFFA